MMCSRGDFGARNPIEARPRAGLAVDLGDDTSADGLAALTKGESRTLLESNVVNELTVELDVVTRHDHLLVGVRGAGGVSERDGDVGGADEELRTVVVHEGRVTAALLLLEDVDLGGELLDGLDGAGDDHDLATLDLLTLDTTEERTHVVTGHALVELLVEHLDTGERGLEGVAETEDLDFGTLLDGASLHTAGHDGTTAGDGEDILDGHEEGLLEVTRRQVEPLVGLLHELEDGLLADLGVAALESGERGTGDDGRVLAIEAVGGEEVAHLHLDELEHLGVVDLVDLVDEDDELLDTDLLGEQKVLTGLRHLTVGSGDDDDGAVHLCSTGDHVSNVIGVTGAVDVGVVAVAGLVLDVGGGDGDTTGTLLGGLVDGGIVDKLAGTLSLVEGLGDGGGERGLAVVDVADGADVHVGLGALELAGLGGVGAHLRGDGDAGELGGADAGTAGKGGGRLGRGAGDEGAGGSGSSSHRPLGGQRPGEGAGCLGAEKAHLEDRIVGSSERGRGCDEEVMTVEGGGSHERA
ncbi:hypothetical protein L1887_58094 [Cichorium endivia]|nr:hypothetical protein L1887_58094 [Cichorium endivia]